jgi:chromosome segregation ATPase
MSDETPCDLSADLAKAQAEITRLTAALADVQSARRRGDEICAGLEIEIARLTSEKKQLASKLDDSVRTRISLDNENKRLHEEVSDEHQRAEEAREAAMWCYHRILLGDDRGMAEERWPWLAEA